MEQGDDGYKRTVAGLLRKRGEMLSEIKDVRERLASLSNDVESVERVLETMGYDGALPTQATRASRIVLFYRNELRSFLKAELSKADAPMTSRELSERLIDMEGKDAKDRRLRNDIVKRVGKALRQMRDHGQVTSRKVRGEFLWTLKNNPT